VTLIITCSNCRRTCVVNEVARSAEPERPAGQMVWVCPRCARRHMWEIPRGGSLEDTARHSLKNSDAYERSTTRRDVYDRVSEAPREAAGKILLGELIWWWREEAGLTKERAAEAAGITVRQLRRIEAGESMPRADNLEGIVHAVGGVMDQAYLLSGSGKKWSEEFKRRLAEQEARINPKVNFQKDAEGQELSPGESPDVEIALGELRRVLPAEPDENHFLFYAHLVYQEYWGKRLGGPITLDDLRAQVVPAVMKLINILERSDSKTVVRRVINVMAREALFFMTEPQVADLLIIFINSISMSAAEEDETRRRIEAEWKQLLPMERLVLALFDRIDPQRQSRLIESCQKLHASAKEVDRWFQEKEPR